MAYAGFNVVPFGGYRMPTSPTTNPPAPTSGNTGAYIGGYNPNDPYGNLPGDPAAIYGAGGKQVVFDPISNQWVPAGTRYAAGTTPAGATSPPTPTAQNPVTTPPAPPTTSPVTTTPSRTQLPPGSIFYPGGGMVPAGSDLSFHGVGVRTSNPTATTAPSATATPPPTTTPSPNSDFLGALQTAIDSLGNLAPNVNPNPSPSQDYSFNANAPSDVAGNWSSYVNMLGYNRL